MLPFHVEFKSGMPVYIQVMYAVKKAFVLGQLQAGDPFPSVRILSQELRINPHTSQKIVTLLKNEGLLEVKPGQGTIIAKAEPADRKKRKALLEGEVEQLVVSAKNMQLAEDDLIDAVRRHWSRLSGAIQ